MIRVVLPGGVSRGRLDILVGPSRRQPLVRARQTAMYLCRELTDLSLPKIGRAFGGRDHTTVLHACRKIAELRESSADVSEDYRNLNRLLST